MEKPSYTTSEAAEILNLHVRAIQRRIQRGQLSLKKGEKVLVSQFPNAFKSGRDWHIPANDLVAIKKEEATP